MPEIKIQGFLGSLGDKQGFAYIMDRTVTGRLASILKSGVLWLYKYHNGYLLKASSTHLRTCLYFCIKLRFKMRFYKAYNWFHLNVTVSNILVVHRH